MRVFSSPLSFILALLLLGACHVNHGWVKYSSNADGFTVYMPAEPKRVVKQEQTPFGKQSVNYVTWAPSTFDMNKLKMLQVGYIDVPRRASADSTSLNILLDSSINLIKKNYTDLDIVSQRINIESYPGRAFIFEDERENATTIVKTCFANNRIYIISAVAKKNYPTNDDLNTFFNSFLVLR